MASRQDELLFVTKQLVPFIIEFEQCIKEYEQRKTSSIADFNLEMNKLGLANENTHIYIYPEISKEATNAEKSNSCKSIGCSFAPTFPAGKYQDREAFLQPKTVLTFVEAPGTGKTHFAYHLTGSNRLVAPLITKHIERLYTVLQKEKVRNDDTQSYRRRLDLIALRFTDFYYRIVILLNNYAEMFLSDKIRSETLKQYILRFLWNGGGKWIGSQDFDYKSVLMSDFNQKPVVWILDEVQLLCYPPFILDVPHRNSQFYSTSGNLLTLIAASLRNKGSLVLTTTFYSSIEDKIESLISKDAGKAEMEVFSHQLSLLPLLNPQQVLLFLNYFITPPNDQLWEYVSFFLQGTIRNTESFLQQLYLKTSSNTNNSINVTQLIHDSLKSVFDAKITITNQAETKIEQKFDKIPFYEYIFCKLAIAGELSLDNLHNKKDSITTFLIRNGVSFTFEHAKNIFKLTSCIEKARMLNYIFSQDNWFDKCYTILNDPQYNPAKKEISLLAEVFVISLLKSHYNDLILPLIERSYAENYKSESQFYFEDSGVSKKASDDIKFSSLMINSLANNVISPIGCTISQFFASPGPYGRIDILGMLQKQNNQNIDESFPNFIPLTVAISRHHSAFDPKKVEFAESLVHEKMKLDFATTDIFNMYLDNISSTPSKSSNSHINDERNKIESSLQTLQKGKGMRVRIMFHPNQKYSNTLKERIALGLYGNSQKVKTNLTDYSVILDDNSCLIEISSGIENEWPKWKPVMSQWKKYFSSEP